MRVNLGFEKTKDMLLKVMLMGLANSHRGQLGRNWRRMQTKCHLYKITVHLLSIASLFLECAHCIA